jgi:SAM-dependent methyltransferase
VTQDYDDAYRTAGWFGDGPERILAAHWEHLPAGARVLDIGVGQGRNALPLAARGCRVTGIDTSRVAVEAAGAAAAAAGLDLDLRRIDYRFMDEPDEPWDAVLCFGLLPMLAPADVGALSEKLRGWVRRGGLLLITGRHTGDPRFGELPAPWQRSGPRSYHDPDGDRHRFYLHPDEIIDLFAGWTVLHHAEGLGESHRHGDGPEERHGIVKAVFQRPSGSLVDVPTVLYGDG